MELIIHDLVTLCIELVNFFILLMIFFKKNIKYKKNKTGLSQKLTDFKLMIVHKTMQIILIFQVLYQIKLAL
jgi:hypothetical protein